MTPKMKTPLTKVNYSEVGRKIRMSACHVSRVLRGERTPTVRTLFLLSRALGRTADSLIKELGLDKEIVKGDSNVSETSDGGNTGERGGKV